MEVGEEYVISDPPERVIVGVQVNTLPARIKKDKIRELLTLARKEDIELLFAHSISSGVLSVFVLGMKLKRKTNEYRELLKRLKDILSTAYIHVSLRDLSGREILKLLKLSLLPSKKRTSLISLLESIPSWQLDIPDMPADFPLLPPSEGIPIGISVNPSKSITGGRVSITRNDIEKGIVITGRGPRKTLLYYLATKLPKDMTPIIFDVGGTSFFLQDQGFQLLVPGANFFADPLLIKNRTIIATAFTLFSRICGINNTLGNEIIRLALHNAGKGIISFINSLQIAPNSVLRSLGNLLLQEFPTDFFSGLDTIRFPSIIDTNKIGPVGNALLFSLIAARSRYMKIKHGKSSVIVLEETRSQQFYPVLENAIENGVPMMIASTYIPENFATIMSFSTRNPSPLLKLEKTKLQQLFVARMPPHMVILKRTFMDPVLVKLLIPIGYRKYPGMYEARSTFAGAILKALNKIEILFGSSKKEDIPTAIKSILYPVVVEACELIDESTPMTVEEGLNILSKHDIKIEIDFSEKDMYILLQQALNALDILRKTLT